MKLVVSKSGMNKQSRSRENGAIIEFASHGALKLLELQPRRSKIDL
jgi:hypothetical protein